MRKGKQGKKGPGRAPRRLLGEDPPSAHLIDADALPDDLDPMGSLPGAGPVPGWSLPAGDLVFPGPTDDASIRHSRRALERQIWLEMGDTRTEGQKRAEELMAEADDLAESDPRAAARLARKALRADPECVDALVYLAEATSATEAECITRLRQAVDVAEKALGERVFREAKGDFWQYLPTRPYMRARECLARALVRDRQLQEASRHCAAMLELNPNDNLGVRYPQLGLLLALGQLHQARQLLRRYRGDAMAVWAWGKMIERFMSKDKRGARTALDRALEVNRYVAVYVVLPQTMSLDVPGSYMFGSDEEARVTMEELGPALVAAEGLYPWLVEQLTELLPGLMPDPRDGVPPHWLARYDEIVALTDAYCAAHLDDEYRDAVREMAGLLCQDGTPGARGKAAGWAAGLVAAVAWVNYAAVAQGPLTQEMIGRAFGVSVGTVGRRLGELRDGLQIVWMDPTWTVPSRLDDNPVIWLREIDGLFQDLRLAPRRVQEQAFQDGLIPWIPADLDEPDP